jgi:lipopolysaccharide/colanic/teichoic acid biosynthesis glycosyltransferase
MGIYSTSVFQALIRHERNRVDRDGNCFSIAVFDSAAINSGQFSERDLCDLLKKEMRGIDEAGWLDDSTIGVLLPSTNLSGGQRFASRACGTSLANGHLLSYEVYSYPDHWISNDKDETAGSEAKGVRIGLGKKGFSAFNIKIPAWKRILDISVSLAVLLVLWPLFLLVAAYIKIVSPGPVFFRQIRVGYGGKPFSFIKFRSMKHGNDQGTHQSHIVTRIRSDNPLLKLDSQDKRIIPGGRFLRKACIDELPQILHVLRGEMSLVGPRPCLPYEATEFLHWHNHRFDVLPGMTGLWQVSGKNKLTFTQMLRLDISYANNMSLWNDIKIIFLTIPAIFNLVTENIASKIKKQTALTEEPNREQAIS